MINHGISRCFIFYFPKVHFFWGFLLGLGLGLGQLWGLPNGCIAAGAINQARPRPFVSAAGLAYHNLPLQGPELAGCGLRTRTIQLMLYFVNPIDYEL